MQTALIIKVRNKEWAIWVTDERQTYEQWVRDGNKVCFSEHELGRIMDVLKTEEHEKKHEAMHWILTSKKITPGIRIDDVRTRRVTFPKVRHPEDPPF